MSHRSRQQVVLTSFRQGSLDTYLNEWRTIRASRVISQEDQSDQDESKWIIRRGGGLLGGLAPGTVHWRRVCINSPSLVARIEIVLLGIPSVSIN